MFWTNFTSVHIGLYFSLLVTSYYSVILWFIWLFPCWWNIGCLQFYYYLKQYFSEYHCRCIFHTNMEVFLQHIFVEELASQRIYEYMCFNFDRFCQYSLQKLNHFINFQQCVTVLVSLHLYQHRYYQSFCLYLMAKERIFYPFMCL